MMQTKKRTLLWLTVGLLFSLLVLLVVSEGLSGNVLITDPEGIPEAADAVMNSIRSGDWKTLDRMVAGNPLLAPAAGEEDSAEKIIWQAYQQSLQWACKEEFGIQGPHVTQRVAVTCLDIPAVTDAMAAILAESTVTASDPENRAEILRAAAEQVLEADVPIMECEITLTFLREKGLWLLVPNSALQTLLSGFTAH